MNNINIEQIVTDSSSEYYSMIEDGKADALLSTDITMAGIDEMFAVAHFSPKPFYFATTKGNTDIIRKLDYAFSTIDQVNPDFTVQLYNKYFTQSSSEVILTESEKAYLSANDTLEVVIYDNKPPFQYLDASTQKPIGITVEMLDLIAERLGINLHYNTVSTYLEYTSFIKDNKADIAGDAFINFNYSKDTESLLTLPWCELPISIMFQEESGFKENGKAAIPYFLQYAVEDSEHNVYYDSVEECLKAVQMGDAEYCYIGDFCSQYFSNNYTYSNFKKASNSGALTQKICFGICDADDLDLLMILNKAISSISQETINEIIYRNTYKQQPITFMNYFHKNRNYIITAAMAVLTVILFISFYIKTCQQKRTRFENMRYDALSNLAIEYFYEYNVKKDELVLSEKSANYFYCKPKIQKFSKRLAELPEEEKIGIWQLGKHIISNAEGSFELCCEMPDHTRQWLKIFSSNIQNNKKQAHAVGKVSNINEIKAEQIRLEQQASIDSLTGIYNIATVKSLIKDYLETYDSNALCAFLILDIDNFKHINDTFGHHKGDVVLAQTAKLISAAFPNDLTGRLGGDEFIVFLKNTTKEDIEKSCKLLCQSLVTETNDILNMSFSCSIGITWALKDKSYEILYQEADAALYETKENNKNGYSFYI